MVTFLREGHYKIPCSLSGATSLAFPSIPTHALYVVQCPLLERDSKMVLSLDHSYLHIHVQLLHTTLKNAGMSINWTYMNSQKPVTHPTHCSSHYNSTCTCMYRPHVHVHNLLAAWPHFHYGRRPTHTLYSTCTSTCGRRY